jgi:SH3-like domain-containing protein
VLSIRILRPGAIGLLALILPLATLLLGGCGRARRQKSLEQVYVAAPQAFLRDRVAAVYNKVATVNNAEQLAVLERSRRFVRVRTRDGKEGWIEQRYLVGEDVFEQFRQLSDQNRNTPAQASGVTRNQTNLHLAPQRDADHLYQLKESTRLQLLKRAPTPKAERGIVVPVKDAGAGKKAEAPKPVMEDWWLARDAEGRSGWVLARMVDIDVPLEIAQYAEGQRIVGAFVLSQVQDGDRQVPQYLLVLTDNRDGLPFDFNGIRVFTWNLRRHRYETAYRERNLFGVFPVRVGRENFDKEGALPTFVLRVQDDTGKVVERKYKLNTPIVRRVLAPGEEPVRVAAAPRRSRRRR